MPQAPRLRSTGRHMRTTVLTSNRNKWIALLTTCMLVIVVGFGGVVALRMRNNLHTQELNISNYKNGLENGALDILVIGSDTRKGNNGAYGDEDDRNSEARADVMMLLQISKDRKNVSVLSFPRDLMVDVPQCTDPESGTVYPAEKSVQINEYLSRGGPGCTVAAISKLTGVNIDHFMLVDFNAVKELSKVVGGVQVCVDAPIDDEYSGLKLPAGTSSVEGEQALAFLRSRHGFSDGSDIGRIQAQQGFLSSLLRKVKREGTLSNPGRLINIAEAITQNVTVDNNLSNISTLVGVGASLGGVDLSNVVFATVPTEPWSQDANRLQVSADAANVFQRLRDDKSLKEEQAPEAPAISAAPVQLDHTVPVSVYNATGLEGRSATIASVVKGLGYTNVTPGTSASPTNFTTVFYSTGYEAEAKEIAAKLNVTRVVATEEVLGVSVTIGADFPSGEAIEKQEAAIAGNATGQTADQHKCQTAFAY